MNTGKQHTRNKKQGNTHTQTDKENKDEHYELPYEVSVE